jgi:FHIPEP family
VTVAPAIDVKLGQPLAGYVEADGTHGLEDRLGAGFAALADHLGLPLRPEVAVHTEPGERAVRVRASGSARPYPLSLFRRAWLTVAPDPLRAELLSAPTAKPNVYPDQWLAASEVLVRPDARPTVWDFVARVAVETVAMHPECLVTAKQADAYFGDDVRDKKAAQDALRRLLDLGVSLRNRELVKTVVLGLLDAGMGLDTAVEEALMRLAWPRIEVRVHRDYLERLGVDLAEPEVAIDDDTLPEELSEPGTVVRRQLAELGSTRAIVLCHDPGLPNDRMVIRVNDYTGLPILLPEPDEVVVHASPSVVESLGASGRPLIDAASGYRLTAIRGPIDPFEQAGLVTTPAVSFFAVSIAREVSPLAYRLFTNEGLEKHLAALHRMYPRLVESALARHAPSELTGVFRELVRERVGARDVRTILNAVLRHDIDPGGQDLVDSLRRELAPRIAYELGQATHSVPGELEAFETTVGFEDRIASFVEADGEADGLREIVRESLSLGYAPADPVILTADRGRGKLRRLLAHEFPSLYVVGRSELSPAVRLRLAGPIGVDRS